VDGVLAAKAIVSRLQLGCRPPAILSVVAAARLVLRRTRLASIAGIALKELRLRRDNLGEASRALATTGAALHP
jgi:hypothetical protein